MRGVRVAAGLALVLGSLYFFYRGVEFLAGQEYVSALVAVVVGFAVLRSGVAFAGAARGQGDGG